MIDAVASLELGGKSGPAEDLPLLQRMVDQGDLEGARALLARLLERWPDAAPLRRYAMVLAPGRSFVVNEPAGRPLARERAVIRDHAREFAGCWIAVYEDRILASGRSLDEVLSAARTAVPADDILVHFEPE